MIKFDFKKFILIIFSVITISLILSIESLPIIQSSNLIDVETSGPPWQPVPNKDYSEQQYNLDLINAYEAWQIDDFSEKVTIAIIDSGIDTDHEEFAGKISSLSYNAYTDEVGIQYVEDDLGHGTNVAGVIGAKIGNNLGIDGIVNNVDLMVIKVNVPGEDGYSNGLIREGIYYAVDNGAKVINLSLGSTYKDSLMQDAINYAFENEVFVVAAAGNDGTDTMYYPAALDHVISVASIDDNSILSDFSNYGDTIDLVAPGDLIYTTDLSNGYAQVSGTSFAAPHVAAVLGLLVSYGHYSFEEINENFKTSSKDLGIIGKDIYYGYGLIDAYRALTTDLVKISFETFTEQTVLPIWILANQTYIINQVVDKDNYIFSGWFLDINLTAKLPAEYVYLEDIILYAGYEPIVFSVTFIVDETIYQTVNIQSGEAILDLPVLSEENKVFYGWYYDIDYIDKYLNQPIFKDTVLFAFLGEPMYVLTFLNYDDSFYSEIVIKSGDTLTLPENPFRPDDELFSYIFVSWDQTFDNIQSNLTVYPIFDRYLLSGLVTLKPGIDTIYKNEEWIDAGLILNNPSLSYNISSEIDEDTTGVYEISYSIIYQDDIVAEIVRFLSVIEKSNVEITLNKAVTTIIIGNEYVETGATSNVGTVEIIGTVNTEKTGRYIILYQVTHEETTYQKSRYVYVINPDFIPNDDIEWYMEKGEDYEE